MPATFTRSVRALTEGIRDILSANLDAKIAEFETNNGGATFDSVSGVNQGTEVITTDAAHGWSDGQRVVYSKNGGDDSTGLTEGATYFVNSITATTLSLHLTAADAVSDTDRVDLTGIAGGETHRLNSLWLDRALEYLATRSPMPPIHTPSVRVRLEGWTRVNPGSTNVEYYNPAVAIITAWLPPKASEEDADELAEWYTAAIADVISANFKTIDGVKLGRVVGLRTSLWPPGVGQADAMTRIAQVQAEFEYRRRRTR